MNTDMHRKPIYMVWWPDTEIEHGRHIISNDERYIELHATYHGDHDEFWIVEYKTTNGELHEVARHNPRYVESIVWE